MYKKVFLRAFRYLNFYLFGGLRTVLIGFCVVYVVLFPPSSIYLVTYFFGVFNNQDGNYLCPLHRWLLRDFIETKFSWFWVVVLICYCRVTWEIKFTQFWLNNVNLGSWIWNSIYFAKEWWYGDNNVARQDIIFLRRK